MKTSDAINLLMAINAIIATPKTRPTAFGYALALNLKKLQPIGESYEAERQSLLKKFATKDENGDPIIEDNTYKLGDNMKAFTEALEELQKEDVDVRLHKIDIAKFPDEIEPHFVSSLLPMVKDQPADTDDPAKKPLANGHAKEDRPAV